MAAEIKKFSGVLDSDSGEDFIEPMSHKYALNGRFYGTTQGLRFQNIPGNILITNELLPSGTNECIGAYEDVQKQRIFYFIWNGSGHNAIFVYNINAQTIQKLIICGTDSTTDILNFDLNQPIVSVNIIYGDAQQGDILYWIDSLKRPTKINISRALGLVTPSYGTFIRSYLDVAKEIPDIPPACAYEDDDSVTVNTVAGILFKFKARYYFDDNDKSATSSQSKVPLPVNETDPSIQSDQTKNSVIKIIVPTGKPNVYKIELLGAQSLGNLFGDYFSIDILNKSDLSIPDNDLFIYKFYNDKIYAPIDINESIELFDYVPITANTQEVLMTNILIYGAITENYNAVVPDVVISSGYANLTTNRLAMIVSQSGDTGFGTGNIHIAIVGQPIDFVEEDDNVVTVNIIMEDGTTVAFNETFELPIALPDIITGLAASATSEGFTVIFSDENNLVINKTNQILAYYNLSNYYDTNIGEIIYVDTIPSYDFSNQETYAPVYFDEKGRSSGVMTNNKITVQTPIYTNGAMPMPYVVLQINSQPPEEAKYFQWTRLSNPTKLKFEYWITDRAYQGTDQTTGIVYAYLSIENLNQYIKDNPATATQLGYTWSVGDRVKILENMVGTNVYTALNDYSILNSINNPTINGVPYTGQFLQILLPPTASTIVIDGTKPNFNFLIEFYTPAKSISQNSNIYYEFGERYLIINPGTSNRYHQGQQQNQTSSQPAIYNFTEGDAYMRQRTIVAGNKISYNIPSGITFNDNGGQVIPETFTETFQTSDYVINSAVLSSDIFSATNNWAEIITPGLSFDVKGVINLQALSTTTSGWGIHLVEKGNPFDHGIVLYDHTGTTTEGTYFSIPINFVYTPPTDPIVTLPLTMRLIVTGLDFGGTIDLLSNGGYVTFTESGSTFSNVKIIDQNFSDFYPSSVNANGRAWAIQPNIKQTFTGTLVRYSLPYTINTTSNNVNRFYAQNFDQYDQGRGDIQRFKVRNRNMRVFQGRGVGNVPIFQNVLTNTTGQDNIGQSENVINNIQYYEGEYGMGYQYTSLVSGKIQDYFIDPVRGYQVRASQDGLVPISELYKGQYFIRGLLTPYNDLTYRRQDGAISRVFGYYDYFDEEYVCILQGGTNSKSNIIPSYAFSFNEKRNAYCSFFSFTDTEFSLSAEENVYDFKNGNIYLRSPNNTNYCQFFGVNYGLQIQLVFNQNLYEKKSMQALSQLTNVPFYCPNIYTNIPYGDAGLVQQSSIPFGNFKLEEGFWNAPLLRDTNTGTLITGATLKGSYLVAMFQIDNAQKLVNLSLIALRPPDSPLNVIK